MKKIILIFAAILVVFSCKKQPNTGDVRVKMTDAPAEYLQVNVDVREVRIKYADGKGWLTLNTNARMYNLLDLQNNVTVDIAEEDEVLIGRIDQIRLVLGSNNTIMLSDSTVQPLLLSSQDEVGLKLNIDATIEGNKETVILIDFDAEKSIVLEGNGAYRLKPVILKKNIYFL